MSSGNSVPAFIIRPETEADRLPVEILTREAFWNLYRPGCDEHYTTHLIHQSQEGQEGHGGHEGHEDYLPDLSCVAETPDGQLIGSIVYTRSRLVNEQTGERVETATFGPLCVHPNWQRQGVGKALIAHTQALATQKGYPAIIILGDPHNYCRHGFKTGRDVNVCMPGGRYPLGLLVLELSPGFFGSVGADQAGQPRKWTLHTSPVFEFDPVAAEAFDAQFAPKEKRHQWSQDLFSMLVRSVVE